MSMANVSGLTAPFTAPDTRGLTSAQLDQLRARQLQSVFALGPIMVAANVANAAVLVWLFRHSSQRTMILSWAAALAVVMALWAPSLRHQQNAPQAAASSRSHRRLTLRALGMGALWSGALAAYPGAAPFERQVLELCIAGMACGGAVALAPVASASAAFVAALALPALVMFSGRGSDLGSASLLFGVIFGAVVLAIIRDRNRSLFANFMQSIRLEASNAILASKVETFDEVGEFGFVTDARGRVVRAAKRFAAMFQMREDEIVGADIVALFAGAAAEDALLRDGAARRVLRAARARSPFDQAVIRLIVRGQEMWISASAKPTFDANGAFAGYRGSVADVTQAKRAERALRHERQFDPLTGLSNRAHFIERASRLLALPDKRAFAVLALDVDRFKNVNEVVGRAGGDGVLVACAQRISALLGRDDVAARFGGDDFYVMLRGRDAVDSAQDYARRLSQAFSAPIVEGGVRLPLLINAGVAIAHEDGADGEALVRNAELALERAKNTAQQVTFFDDAADSQLRERRHLELLLVEAVERSQLDVHFQPLIDVASGRVVACEALLRWTHPVRGPIPPSVFVPLAEETGLITRIGEWVLNQACAEAMRWGDEVSIAVNVSPVQFRNGLVGHVAGALARSGLPARRLELEITETALINDKAYALEQMHALRALGVRLSLDDFGTGYASLSYLADMPFDKIKIDRSFVREVASRHDSGAIVQAITDLASRLGLNTTAEGVETLQDLEWLRAAGCKEAQGYLFSRAAPAGQVREMIARNERRALGKVG